MSTPSGSPLEQAAERARALRNVLTNWGAFVINALIAFMISPYVVHTLGDEAYGVLVLVGSLVGYLGLIDIGVRGAVTKYVATYHAAERHEDAGRLASAALAFFGAAGVVTIAISAVIAWTLLPHFDVPEPLQTVAAWVLVLSGGSIAASLMSGVFGGVVVGVQRFDRLNAITIGVAVLRGAGTVGVLAMGGGLLGLSLVQLASSILQGLATFVLARMLYPELSITRGDWSREHLRTLITFGVTSTFLNASTTLIDYSDSLVIGATLTVASITPFAIAANLCFYTRQVVSGISHTVAPMAGALEGRQQLERVRGMFVSGARFATLAIAPIVVVFWVRGATFIGLWMGPEYAGPSGEVLIALGVAIYVFASFQVLASAMIGLNRHAGLVPVFLAEAAANVVLSILLAREIGIVGVAWGTAIPRLVNCLVVGPLYARRHAGVELGTYWTEILLRPSIAMIPFALANHAVETSWGAPNLVVYFGQVLLTLPLAGLGAWWGVLHRDERDSASATIAGALGLHRASAGSGDD